MKTGIDRSLSECRASGYPVITHGKSALDPYKCYRVTISNPYAWTDCGRAVKMNRQGADEEDIYDLNSMMSYEYVWHAFLDAGPGIKSYCDFDNCPYPSPTENPTFEEMASLVGTIHSYAGL